MGETGSPFSVSGNEATVEGRVVSNVGGPIEYWAQYGPTAGYGSETSHASVPTDPNVRFSVFATISGLARSTRYHYRICARDSQQSGGQPGCGVDQTLTTQSFACGETVTTSVRLTGNLECSFETSPSLVIGADGIEINLAGHSLRVPVATGGSPSVIFNEGHADVTIRNGSVEGVIELEGASHNLIRDVDGLSASDVVHIEGGEANAVRASSVVARGAGVSANGSDDLVVAGTRAFAFLGPGIAVVGDRARVVRNRLPADFANFVPGIQIAGSDNRIVDNRVTGGWLEGGIVVRSGARNVIAENEVSDVRFPTGGPPPHLGDGILVDPPTTGTFLRDNLVQRNDADGIEVRSADARLRDNVANDNVLLGIEAAAGVADLGGNRASGNGNPLQCVNVFCSP
jgi:parallel beta-helix repeat protein